MKYHKLLEFADVRIHGLFPVYDIEKIPLIVRFPFVGKFLESLSLFMVVAVHHLGNRVLKCQIVDFYLLAASLALFLYSC